MAENLNKTTIVFDEVTNNKEMQIRELEAKILALWHDKETQE